MEDLNDCPVNDFDSLYLRLRSLVTLYVEYKLEGNDYIFFDEIIDDVVENLIFKADIFHVPRRSPYFWWGFVRKRGWTVIDQYVVKEQANYRHLKALEFNFAHDPKCFYRFTEKRLKELISTGAFTLLLPAIEAQDKELGQYLYKQIKSYIKHAPTAMLVRLYKNLSTVQKREFKSCEHNVKGLWYREQPSKRKRMRQGKRL